MKSTDGWIFSPALDFWVFLFPPVFGAACFVFLRQVFPSLLHQESWIPVVLIGIAFDKLHSYSTVFRTYLDPHEWRTRPRRLILLPPLVYLGLVLTAMWTSMQLMWFSVLYLVIFHFVRQQIGWISYVSRKAGESRSLDQKLDRSMIYALTLFPIASWHVAGSHFTWWNGFAFPTFISVSWYRCLSVLFTVFCVCYITRQIHRIRKEGRIVWPRYQIIFSTFLAWFFGTLVWGSQVAYLLILMVSHATPYIVLTAGYHRRHGLSRLRAAGFPVVMIALLGLAYLDRAALNIFFEHQLIPIFPAFRVILSSGWMIALSALLALPIALHVAFDTYVWKVRNSPVPLSKLLSPGS